MTHPFSNIVPHHTWALLGLTACGQSNTVATHSVDVGLKEPISIQQTVESDPSTTPEMEDGEHSGNSPMLANQDENARLLSPSTLDDWERQILADQLRHIRDGVQLFSKREGFGLCVSAPKGPVKSACDTFVGAIPGVLAHGDYFLRARLKAPSIGEDWLVRMEEECTLQSPGNPKEQTLSKVHNYNVLYKGPVKGKERFYPIRMTNVQSPNTAGRKDCVVKLYSHRPDVGRKPDTASLSDSQRILIGEVRYTVPGINDNAPIPSEFLERFKTGETTSPTPSNPEPKSESNP